MTNNKFLLGIGIISKHMPPEEKDNFGVQATHDQLWFGDPNWIDSLEDKERLDELGWFIDEDSYSCNT